MYKFIDDNIYLLFNLMCLSFIMTSFPLFGITAKLVCIAVGCILFGFVVRVPISKYINKEF